MSAQEKVPNVILRRIREEERQETRSEFAEAMARTAAGLGEAVTPSERYVARLEDGDTSYPHPAHRRVLAALCGRPINQLGFSSPKSAMRTPDGNSQGYAIGQPPAQAHRTARPSLDEIEFIRRSLNEMVGDSPMSEATIEDWEHTALQHARATKYEPPGQLLVALTSDLVDLKQEISRCRSALALRRLTRVAAQMAGLMCLTLVKLDERSAFRRWARTARIAASEAGDPLTLAWVRAEEAYGHYYSGSIDEAIDVARHAQDIVPGIPNVGAALAAALEARAQAALGRRAETETALRRAETILEALDASETRPSAFGYNEAQIRFHAGSAYTHLQDTESAWSAQTKALQLIPLSDYTDRTLTHLDRAICLAHDGDGTEAARYAAEAFCSLTENQRSGIILLRAREALDAIPGQQRALPPARELEDLLAPSASDTWSESE